MSVVGVRYSTIYAVTKLVVLLATALSASAFTRTGLAVTGRMASAWRCRIVVTALLFGTLQLHNPWSNDPVGAT